jgi:hypothetical protein
MTLVIAVLVGALTLGAIQASYAMNAEPLDDASLTFLGVRAVGSNTLTDVVARLGTTAVWGTGDAAESESQICYSVPTTNGSVIVVFASNNAMSEPRPSEPYRCPQHYERSQARHIAKRGSKNSWPAPAT